MALHEVLDRCARAGLRRSSTWASNLVHSLAPRTVPRRNSDAPGVVLSVNTMPRPQEAVCRSLASGCSSPDGVTDVEHNGGVSPSDRDDMGPALVRTECRTS